ncbi:FAD-dependent oxidoreductase [Paenibacillus borealis]|uniref:Pyridine nucleotide-disulfide oxidoreductase n=1 Tax=Paenibacillus borealis TaxID=160799 RepID=A0A089L977_PAEBO|nr:FAD-dependent oxidoreductase [Paenibacillus borealis]AIQ57362.1 pyridine nucleotide-disulfide oxidoreductase [Paenibacillus borealis]
MRKETVKTDVTVVGGGLAGVCAAIAAARLGQKVALVNNRPVLGGNSSSEVRVWVCGATSHGIHRYARETGIMGELFVENQYRNKDGNPYLWDMVVLEAVQAEPNIQLFLNTDVHEAEADEEAGGGRRIRSVTGWMMGSERSIRFESPVYLDCTGDGLVGFLAGAKYRLGREAREEFNEEWAPEVPDDITLGSTLLFYTKDAGHPVKFIPPAMAIDVTQTSITENRIIRSGDNGCAYWWIEFGGEQDTVHDNEAIRDELWSIIYGIWGYIKNSGKFDAGNMTLEWVGSLPGKREYRRFVGDYILNQNDILAQREFTDRIGFGGWSIDLHPPQGVYATESGSKHMYSDGSYHIPFRSLYSVNVNNLLMAGRDISASHVAFGTTRVMATCAVIGEAAGTGAALCAAKGITPRELHAGHLQELQQTMLRQDASVLGLRNEDVADLALRAAVSASSERSRFAVEESAFTVLLETDIGITVPADPLLDGIELLVDAGEAAELTVELWETGRPENYVPHALVQTASASVSAGERQWVKLALHWQPETPRNAFLIVKANAAIALHMADQPASGMLAYWKRDKPVVSRDFGENQPAQPLVLWDKKKFDHTAPCIRLAGPTQAFAADKAVDGYLRPYGGPHFWSSEQLVPGRPEWLELSWSTPVAIREVHITFNDDVNEDLINLHHHITPFDILPTLVKDYRIEAYTGGEWTMVAEVQDNHKRKHVHTLSEAVTTDRLRFVVLSTNGSGYAEIIEVRAYA